MEQNREIKFEYGFQSVNGIVKKVYSLSQIPNIKELCDVWNVLPIVYVRQFTGQKVLQDIYQGDILEDYGVVIWSQYNLGWFVELFDQSFEASKPLYDIPIVKVIGNIYQTPELLK